jgi:transcription initiation factor IIE alpha subunit
MKILLFFTLVFFSSLSGVIAQKAGKGVALKPNEFYSCPNHSQVTSHEPGKCSICGTELSSSKKEIRAANTIKNYTCPAHMDIVTHNPGKCPKCGRKLNLSAKEQLKSEVSKVYTCPMHPEVALDKDGNCPECGKALVEKKEPKKS